mgnify:CR=1 FL=1
MDLKETGKKLKPFAPVLSVAVVASCVAGTLSGYQPPVYAAQEQSETVKDETEKAEEEQVQVTKGSFDLTDGVYKGTGTGYAGEITVAVQIKDKQIVAIDIIGAGIGEYVLVAQGSAARIGCGEETAPIDAAIVGIVDDGAGLE